MRTLLISAIALASLGGVALAKDVVVTPAPAPGVVIEHHDADAAHRKVVINKENGCTTKTVKKSDDMGNSVTRTKSNC